MPKINSKTCDLCGTCISVCPTAALSMSATILKLDEERCTHCGLCIHVCPVAALSKGSGYVDNE